MCFANNLQGKMPIWYNMTFLELMKEDNLLGVQCCPHFKVWPPSIFLHFCKCGVVISLYVGWLFWTLKSLYLLFLVIALHKTSCNWSQLVVGNLCHVARLVFTSFSPVASKFKIQKTGLRLSVQLPPKKMKRLDQTGLLNTNLVVFC